MPLGSIRCYLLCGLQECQGNVGKIRLPRKKEYKVPHSILPELWTILQPLFCWGYFYFEIWLSVKCCSLSHFFFLHQIIRCLTQKFLSDTPDSQPCERRGIHCPGLCLVVPGSICTSSTKSIYSCFANPKEKQLLLYFSFGDYSI